MKNKRIDLNKTKIQSGSFNKKQLIDFIKSSNTCIGKDILVQHEYIEIIDANNNIQKELNSKSICGTIEITQGKQEMKIDKTDLILQEIRNINFEMSNMKNDFNEFKVEVKNEFKKVNSRLDNVEKEFSEFKVEVKEEFKKVNSRLDNVEGEVKQINLRLDNVENDIKDIKNCPTIKSELNISK